MTFLDIQGTGRLCFLFALLFAKLGCDEKMDLPPVTWEGKNISFGTVQDELPCNGTLATIDRRVDFLNEMLGTTLPPGKKIRLYLMKGEMNRTPCHEDARGCASVIDNEMYAFVANLDTAEHEITHLLLWPFCVGHKLFVEGFAECFGGLFHNDSLAWTHSRTDVETMVKNNRVDTYPYQKAGIFTRYLIHRFGLSKIKEAAFYSKPGWRWREFNRGFEKILGVSFDEVVNDFEADDKGCYEIFLRCEYPEISLSDDGLWTQDIQIDCKDNETIGDAISDTMETSRLLQITQAGTYRVCITDESRPFCDEQVNSPVASEENDAGPNDGGAATDDIKISLQSARCNAGPGCSKVYSTMAVSPGTFHTDFLEPGLFELRFESSAETAALSNRSFVEIQRLD